MGEQVIVVDTREPKYIIDQLASYRLTVMTAALTAGDYLFLPHGLKVGIERKRIDDLLNSLRDGRMIAQAHKLIDEYDVAMILIEGRYDYSTSGVVTYEANGGWHESGWSWDSFTGMLLDLKWMGLIFHECISGDAAREIARLVGSLSKDEHKWIQSRERPNVIAIDPAYKDTVWSLCAFKGLSAQSAETLLSNYGSFEDVVAMFTKHPDMIAELKLDGKRRFGKRAYDISEQMKADYGAATIQNS